MRLEVIAGQAIEAELPFPLVAHALGGAQRVGPVDDRPATQAGAGQQHDIQIGGLGRTAAPVEVPVGGNLQLSEIAVIEIATGLEHYHRQSLLGQDTRHHATAGARADHAHVRLQRRVRLRRVRDQRPVGHRRRREGTGIAERPPVRILPALVPQPIEQKQHRRPQRVDRPGHIRSPRPNLPHDPFARARRAAQQVLTGKRVEQRQQARALLLRHVGQQVLDHVRHPQVTRLAGKEAVGVRNARDRRHDGVAHSAQNIAAGFGELEHGIPLCVAPQAR